MDGDIQAGHVREYGRVLCLRVLPEFASVGLAELTRADIQSFVDGMFAEELAPSTIRNTVNPLQAIYRYAVRHRPADLGDGLLRRIAVGRASGLQRSDIDERRAEINVHRSWDQHEGPIALKSKAGTRTVSLLGVLRARLDLRGPTSGSDLVFSETGAEACLTRRRSTTEPSEPGRQQMSARSLAECEGREPELLLPISSTSAAIPSRR